MFFVAVGFPLGGHGLGWIHLDVDGEAMRVLAELTLVLVLFTDASRIDLRCLRREKSLPARLLGIGMPLTIVAGAAVALALWPELGWFGTSVGPYRYKLITGDFVARSHILAGNVSDPDAPPTGTYNSAGFVVRDPGSLSPNQENWVMYNHGAQVFNAGAGHPLATETKTTVNSASILTLRPTLSATSNSGELALCRTGDLIHMFKWMDDESGWTLEETYDRPDFPPEVQLGLVVNGWTNADLRAEFDYIRIQNQPIADSDACVTLLPEPGVGAMLVSGALLLHAVSRRRA